jgi:predicted lipoprotein with Yx(FWY)xxD motif
MAVATRKTSLRIAVIAAVAAAVAVSAAVWSGTGAASARHVTKSPTVMTRKVGKYGVILVNGKGLTLYMFVPDKRKRVTCKASCAVIWPPLKIKAGQKPTAGGAAKKALLGTYKTASGRVVSYNRWPLYTYFTDHKPGQAKGQALDQSGGLWYVLSPSGKVIKTKP